MSTKGLRLRCACRRGVCVCVCVCVSAQKVDIREARKWWWTSAMTSPHMIVSTCVSGLPFPVCFGSLKVLLVFFRDYKSAEIRSGRLLHQRRVDHRLAQEVWHRRDGLPLQETLRRAGVLTGARSYHWNPGCHGNEVYCIVHRAKYTLHVSTVAQWEQHCRNTGVSWTHYFPPVTCHQRWWSESESVLLATHIFKIFKIQCMYDESAHVNGVTANKADSVSDSDHQLLGWCHTFLTHPAVRVFGLLFFSTWWI